MESMAKSNKHYKLRIEQKPLIKAEKCGIINNDYYDKGR
jgi:hypothetical protein